MPDWFWYLVVFGYGAVVGSFLNVVIYRMPLGRSVAKPASYCPGCKRYLGFFDNIPLLSFLFLGARCRYCRRPISWRYFSVELLTACLWTVLLWKISGEYGFTWVNYVAHALVVSILVAVIFIDLDHFFIPDSLNFIGFFIGVARDVTVLGLIWFTDPYLWRSVSGNYTYFGWLPKSIAGALLYAGILFAISFFGWLVYARYENEPVLRTARRFFIDDEEPSPETEIEAGEEEEMEEEQGEPVRLRFSPGLLALASALLVVPVIGVWAVAAFAIPVLAFTFLTRQPGEEAFAAMSRFFRANDLADYEPPTPAVVAVEEAPLAETDLETPDALEPSEPAELSATAVMAAEADQFAIEAESGKHGVMGLGDVKLALAIGAILGPGMAVLSLLFATAAGAIVGIALALRHGKSLRLGIPFGPFMALGAVLAMLYGDTLVRWYLATSGLGGGR